jgi:hypothetical protein
MALTLTSTAFQNGQAIPETYVQAGNNKSPPLAWRAPPEGTKSFVPVVEDHDAPVGTVTHWIAYDIPADADGLFEGLDSGQIPQGSNDMGNARYDGPKPPKVTDHTAIISGWRRWIPPRWAYPTIPIPMRLKRRHAVMSWPKSN